MWVRLSVDQRSALEVGRRRRRRRRGTLEPDEDEGAADGDEDDDAERAHLRGFFEAFEHMMTGAEAGGFDGYELLRGFERQLRAEDVLDDGGELGAGVARRRRRAYADIIHHVASYYGHLGRAAPAVEAGGRSRRS